MSISLELGRAVLRSSDAHLDLQLITSISIAPQQHLLEDQQLSPSEVLNRIRSAEAFVFPGSQFEFLLDIDICGQKLSHPQKEDLVGAIIAAPVEYVKGFELHFINNVIGVGTIKASAFFTKRFLAQWLTSGRSWKHTY